MIDQEPSQRQRFLTPAPPRPIGLQRVLALGWNAAHRSEIASEVGESGFEVTVCSTASEARQLLESTDFQALLFDAQLYGETPASFLAWLDALGPRRPYTIASIGEAHAAEAAGWIGRGADDLLPCPLQPGSLQARLALMEARLAERDMAAEELATLRRAHGRYESLFLEAPDALLVLKNRQGKVIGVNRAVREVLGYDGKALLGKYMSLILPDIFGRDGFASRGDVLSGATVLQAVPYKKPDGEVRYLDIVMSPVPWDRGYAVLMACRDVTGREGAEGDRIRGSKDEALSRFATGVAGEFGDILTSIDGNLSLLQEAPHLGEEGRETLERAKEGCDRGRDLTVELAKLGGASRSSRKASVALPRIAEKAVQFALFDHDHLRPVFRIADGLPRVHGNEAQLRQAVEAVAKNAAEALAPRADRPGVLTVEISEHRVDSDSKLPLREGNYVLARFRDNGPGLEEGDLRRVFDPYFSGSGGKRGFGLTRTAAVARMHGGTVVASSQPGVGTTVELYLPVAEGGNERGASTPNEKAMRVLVLDDEPHILTMLERALAAGGHDVFSAATGEDAYRAFEKAVDFGRPFDVLLFDLDIRGGMGGRETLARIRATHPEVKAIVTTGYVDDTVLENYLEHGFCGVLRKPFRLEHLTATIERLGSIRA